MISSPEAVAWRRTPGPVAYPDALAFMEARVAAIHAGRASECVWLVEHPPLYTAGVSADADEVIGEVGFPIHASGRGGRHTYHGPGQRVCYVMLDLRRRRRDVRAFVHDLESWLIGALERLGVVAGRRDGLTGVWTSTKPHHRPAKIAAIGVRLSRWISSHGVSINVCPDLSHFSAIVPCGLHGETVTSLAALGIAATMEDLDVALGDAFGDVFARCIRLEERFPSHGAQRLRS